MTLPRLLVVALLGIGLPAATPAYAAAGARIWIASAADRVFSTSRPAGGAPTSIALYAARGEQEAAQIAIRPSSAATLTDLRVTATALSGPGGAGIPASNILVRRAYDHPDVEVMAGDAERPPAGRASYYDALVENVPRDLPGGITQPYHYSVTVPAGQAPGVYAGRVLVSSASMGLRLVDVRLTVYEVTVPATDESTFKMNNWFTSAGWDYNGTERSIPAQYDHAPMYSGNWWKVIANIAANHRRHRNNVIYADFQALLIPKTTAGPGGRLRFDWSIFDKFVNTFVAAGAMQYIYTPTLLEPVAGGKAGAEILRGVGGGGTAVKRDVVAPGGADANAYYDQVFPALKAHLDEMRWTDRFYLSALDEPRTQAQVDAANWLYAKYRQYFPEPLTNEAHLQPLNGLDGNLTTVTPIIYHYEQQIGYFQNLRVNGTELWLYNCIDPRGPQMNRFISYHLAKTRLTPWLTWKIGGTGYLHWGWNFWFDDIGNPGAPADTFNGRQSGDHWLVRPNKAAYDIYDSLRSETQLDGLEDYELLNLLARSKPLTARAIAAGLITDTVTYTRSGAAVDLAHKQILDQLTDGGPDHRYPFADDFGGGDGEWVRGRGTWSVASTGEYLQTGTSGWGFTSTPKNRAYADVAASADLKIVGVNPEGGDTNWAGFMIRSSNATDMDTGYLVALRDNRQVFIYRSGKELAHAEAPDYRPGTYTRFRVTAFGDRLSVYVGDKAEPVLTLTDSAYRAGQVALVTGGASVRFDNVVLDAVDNLAVVQQVPAA
ncbi:glycoside hydrolase domain-containing protein [Nonomuraea jabiensis]|uniref:glycoside hydrolase domain-containing protein n=1 Tax=Nonomuraea jabiensis TaxID=882448 RepID=UPI003D71EE7F